jgi:hypothetical protein
LQFLHATGTSTLLEYFNFLICVLFEREDHFLYYLYCSTIHRFLFLAVFPPKVDLLEADSLKVP